MRVCSDRPLEISESLFRFALSRPDSRSFKVGRSKMRILAQGFIKPMKGVRVVARRTKPQKHERVQVVKIIVRVRSARPGFKNRSRFRQAALDIKQSPALRVLHRHRAWPAKLYGMS